MINISVTHVTGTGPYVVTITTPVGVETQVTKSARQALNYIASYLVHNIVRLSSDSNFQ
jgi:hypothetical protein